jgi:hypothetical protein
MITVVNDRVLPGIGDIESLCSSARMALLNVFTC